MAWLLDTNIAVHLIEGDAFITAKVAQSRSPISISAISRVELENGVYRSFDQQKTRREALAIILGSIDVLAFDNNVADVYAMIVAEMGYSRALVFDRMIAAQAIAADLTLVTRNAADFRGIRGLKLDMW